MHAITLKIHQLIHYLVEQKILEREHGNRLETILRGTPARLVQLLSTETKLNVQDISKTLSQFFKLPIHDLSTTKVDDIEMTDAQRDVFDHIEALPLLSKKNELYVAVANPLLVSELKLKLNQLNFTVKPVVVSENSLKNIRQQLDLKEINPSGTESKTTSKTKKKAKDDKKSAFNTVHDLRDFPVVRFINKTINDAITQKASDIHFEPFETEYRIRFRVDGILQDYAAPNISLAPRLTARLKVISGLDISEKRVPQDGRFKILTDDQKPIGFRVSTCPTLFGEKIVLRVLDPASSQLGIDALGFIGKQQDDFEKAIHQHQGMILVTGPTGSGKTVTLYTALNELNTNEKNISTAEDPVEIYLPGINQVNINTKTGLTFAAALRAFLRQDPDIIMLGEIRDQETADIALKAAQTGHLVLSTLHTNSAAESLSRLNNMGIASYNIATSINLVIAQRLLRRLCKHCKKAQKIDEPILIEQGFNKEETARLKLYEAVGCDKCHQGFFGRIAVFEVLPMTQDMQKLVIEEVDSISIQEQAVKNGMLTLRESGLHHLKAGETSLTELNRVLS